jgi:hypothetical protein
MSDQSPAMTNWLVAIGLAERGHLGSEIEEPAVAEGEARSFAGQDYGPIIDVWDDLSAEGAEAIRRAGLNEDAVRLCARDSFELDALYAKQLGYPDLATRLIEEQQRRPARTYQTSFMQETTASDRSFQVTGLSAGMIFCPCPVTGAILESRHALLVPLAPVQCYIAYYFSGVEPFFVVAASFGGTKSILYLPRLNVIIRLQNPHFQWAGHWEGFVNSLKFFACRYPLSTRNYLEGETKPALAVGMINGFGHQLWNDMSALARVCQNGDWKNVDSAIVGPYDFFDSDSVGPLRFRNIIKPTSVDELYLAPLRAQLFAVRPTTAMSTAEGADFVLREAEKRVSEQQRRMAEEGAGRALLLWLNVRAHNKIWLNQLDELVLLSKRLVADFGDVGIYVDGMPDCDKVVREIVASIDKSVCVYDGTKAPPYDKLYWASKVDCYISPIGSGLCVIQMIAGKQGVAHAEHQHLGHLPYMAEWRDDVPVPLVPERTDVQDVQPGVAYSNYTITPGVISELLYEVIRRISKFSTA